MVNPISANSQAGLPVERLRQQAEELEGVFLHTLVKQMFSGIETKGAFGGGFGEETWRSMQAEQMAQAMAEAGGIGLADQILGDLIAVQEAANSNVPAGAAIAYKGATR
jgi:Rod binding domain-containing protein